MRTIKDQDLKAQAATLADGELFLNEYGELGIKTSEDRGTVLTVDGRNLVIGQSLCDGVRGAQWQDEIRAPKIVGYSPNGGRVYEQGCVQNGPMQTWDYA